jgi:hypothetical protein
MEKLDYGCLVDKKSRDMISQEKEGEEGKIEGAYSHS